MNPPRFIPLLLIALALGPVTAAVGAVAKRKPPESDLASIEARKTAVDLAMSLAKVDTPESLSGTSLPRPFNPPGFSLNGPPVAAGPVAAGPAPKAYGDREILIALASKVQPKGTLSLGSEALLIFGKKNLRAGDHLTVSFEGQDYNLELVTFDRTNFTLRLNKEEITRSIKPGKNP
jgi:hypothetical protein